MSDLFMAVKETVSALDAGKRYGMEPTYQGFCRCCFHSERTASLKLYAGTSVDDHSGFYCFGCHTGGDVIKLTGQIFGITPKESALMLARDFCIPFDDDQGYQPDSKAVQEAKAMKSAETALNKQIQRFMFATYDYLRALEAIVSRGDLNDPNYLTAIYDIETVRFYADQWEDGDYMERAELAIRGKDIFEQYERKLSIITERSSG